MSTPRALVVLAPVALAAVALGAGCVDTELGLAVEITSASGAVSAGAAGDVVMVTLGVDYRAGAFAEEAHELQPQSIDVLLDGTPIVTLTPERPPVFVPRVAPGESRSVTFRATSAEGAASDPRRLCGAGGTVVFRWVDLTTLAVGTSEAAASFTCE